MAMLDNETRERIMDFFTAAELVEYLVDGGFMTFEDLLCQIDCEIISALPDLSELMGVHDEG